MSAEVVLLVVVLVAVVASVLLTAYLLAHRVDRLHIRTDLARSALIGAIGRRHVVAAAVAGALREVDPAAAQRVSDAVSLAVDHPAHRVAGTDPAPGPDARRWSGVDDDEKTSAERAENELGLVLSGLDADAVSGELADQLEDVSDRVLMARRFYNDAVRDTRDLRERPVVRALRLAGRAPMPDYVELVDPPPRDA